MVDLLTTVRDANPSDLVLWFNTWYYFTMHFNLSFFFPMLMHIVFRQTIAIEKDERTHEITASAWLNEKSECQNLSYHYVKTIHLGFCTSPPAHLSSHDPLNMTGFFWLLLKTNLLTLTPKKTDNYRTRQRTYPTSLTSCSGNNRLPEQEKQDCKNKSRKANTQWPTSNHVWMIAPDWCVSQVTDCCGGGLTLQKLLVQVIAVTL